MIFSFICGTNFFCLYLTKQFDIYRLHLHHKGLHTIPHEIGLLTQLTSLHLQANNLQTIPSSIFELTNLKMLHLNHNKLQIISPEIGQLVSLTCLSLHNNPLHAISETIEQCTMENMRCFEWCHQNSSSTMCLCPKELLTKKFLYDNRGK